MTYAYDWVDAYRAFEDRIRASDGDALRVRWEFGRALLAELGPRERLPNGRRDEIAKAVAIGRAEVNNRMQFAREYATEERLLTPLAGSARGTTSWSAGSGAGDRPGRLRAPPRRATLAGRTATSSTHSASHGRYGPPPAGNGGGVRGRRGVRE